MSFFQGNNTAVNMQGSARLSDQEQQQLLQDTLSELKHLKNNVVKSHMNNGMHADNMAEYMCAALHATQLATAEQDIEQLCSAQAQKTQQFSSDNPFANQPTPMLKV